MRFYRLCVIICLFGILGCNTEKSLELFDLNNIDTTLIKEQDAHFEIVRENGDNFIKVYNGFTIREPGVKILSPEINSWDLDGYYKIKADVANVGDEFIQVEMFVGNDPDGLVRWYCSNYADLEPGESKTIEVELAWTPWVFSPQIVVEGMRGIPGKFKMDISEIDEITFCSRYATTNNEFLIKRVWAEGELEIRDTTGFFPFIDEFGQYAHRDWKGKVHNDEELNLYAEKELSMLNEEPGAGDRSIYGGWLAGPRLDSTGYFRTEKYNGKWWMVDPEGYLFWSAGMNCVASHHPKTGVTDRETYYEFLPHKDTVWKEFYSKSKWASHGFYKDKIPFTSFNFYEANLYKKYGDEWEGKFSDLAHKRFKNWGLNTFGNVSDSATCVQQKTPYVGTVWLRKTPEIEGSEGFWGKFHDVFDPGFRAAVQKSMQTQKRGANDPWCIGYFVDNELSWGQLGSLSEGVLKSPADQAAKVEFVNDLKLKYNNIEALNAVWKTNHASWDKLQETQETPDFDAAYDDLVAFYKKIAQTYFSTVKEELQKIAPNQCYLGCRFAWANNDVVVGTAAKYVDILSFNKYEYSVEKLSLPPGVDKPVMIGEFHFGSLDRGSCHPGLRMAKDQLERGKMYKSYIQGALRNKYLVGAHWFQYTDQPVTGRGDGENYNVGFVDICDNPFEEFIEKVKETTYSMYNYRFEN